MTQTETYYTRNAILLFWDGTYVLSTGKLCFDNLMSVTPLLNAVMLLNSDEHITLRVTEFEYESTQTNADADIEIMSEDLAYWLEDEAVVITRQEIFKMQGIPDLPVELDSAYRAIKNYYRDEISV